MTARVFDYFDSITLPRPDLNRLFYLIGLSDSLAYRKAQNFLCRSDRVNIVSREHGVVVLEVAIINGFH